MTIRKLYAVSALAVGVAGMAQDAMAALAVSSATDPVTGLGNVTPYVLSVIAGVIALVCGVRAGGAYLHERPIGPPVAQGLAAVGVALGGAAATSYWTRG